MTGINPTCPPLREGEGRKHASLLNSYLTFVFFVRFGVEAFGGRVLPLGVKREDPVTLLDRCHTFFFLKDLSAKTRVIRVIRVLCLSF